MFKKLLLTSAFLATVANTSTLAQTAPFGVTGTVSPASCTVSLTGGVINLGTVMQTAVKGYTVITGTNPVYGMAQQRIPVGVSCTTAAKVALSFVDNKSGKVIALDANDAVRFGLTDGAGTTAIGSYQILFDTAATTIDGAAPGGYLNAPSATGTWAKTASTSVFVSNTIVPSYPLGFAKSANATAPDLYKTLTGNLVVQVYLGKTYVDSATVDIMPTGSGTLTLIYL